MVIINGKIYSGNNVIITNGQIITTGNELGKTKKFEEKRVEDANDIEKITINSSIVEVNVSVSNSSKVETHFYGQANIDGDIDFDVYMINRELKIELKFNGTLYNGELKLDVTIPQKTFRAITLNSSSGNISLLDEYLSTEDLRLKTQSGFINTSATFTNASISTMSGNFALCCIAKKDIFINISTMSGDGLLTFNNIKTIKLLKSSMSGHISNHYQGSVGFVANINISTMSGDVKIM